MARPRYNPDIHHRRNLRVSHHDYTSTGIYFVTTCAEHRDPIFEMPELRQILEETWRSLPERFPGMTLDEFIIMPDHVHFILWLDNAREDPPHLGDVVGACDLSPRLEAGGFPPSRVGVPASLEAARWTFVQSRLTLPPQAFAFRRATAVASQSDSHQERGCCSWQMKESVYGVQHGHVFTRDPSSRNPPKRSSVLKVLELL